MQFIKFPLKKWEYLLHAKIMNGRKRHVQFLVYLESCHNDKDQWESGYCQKENLPNVCEIEVEWVAWV